MIFDKGAEKEKKNKDKLKKFAKCMNKPMQWAKKSRMEMGYWLIDLMDMLVKMIEVLSTIKCSIKQVCKYFKNIFFSQTQ